MTPLVSGVTTYGYRLYVEDQESYFFADFTQAMMQLIAWVNTGCRCIIESADGSPLPLFRLTGRIHWCGEFQRADEGAIREVDSEGLLPCDKR